MIETVTVSGSETAAIGPKLTGGTDVRHFPGVALVFAATNLNLSAHWITDTWGGGWRTCRASQSAFCKFTFM
jgi:hypothetical protein